MTGVPVVYRKSNDVVASFSFENLATGQGVVALDSYISSMSGATLVAYGNVSSGQDLWSDPLRSASVTTTANVQTDKTYDFDNTPAVLASRVKGSALCELEFVGHSAGGAGFIYATANIIKVSGVTTTNIGTARSTNAVFSTSYVQKKCLLTIPLTETTISVGEYLRLEIILSLYANNTADGWLYADPHNRDDTGTGGALASNGEHTFLRWYIPVKIEV